jgi:CheY-like chemotaxis protein
MDAIGQLAGGIAHDFNNLLTAILCNLDLILDNPGANESTKDLAGAAHNAASRAASLTQRLLGFSRRHKLDWAPTQVNSVVEEVVALLRRTIDPLIRIETRLAPDLWTVQGDAVQLNQVLMNLCLNARDAMPEGGRLTIETACVAPTDLPPNLRAGRTTDFVRLRVIDNGLGMTDEVKARIYEPFFTTKEVGKGTGLGLPMVFAIVRQHKGWIDCASEFGYGTRFDIYLPRGEEARILDAGVLTPAPRGFGLGTVLVVDDEDMIRRVASQALKAHGYRVLEAADGQQAIDLYANEGEGIELVLLDLTMPVLSGHETFRHLVQLNSRVRVLFASGYAEEQLSDLEKELMTGFLKKPYRPNELILAVSEALQRRGHGSTTIARPAPRKQLSYTS